MPFIFTVSYLLQFKLLMQLEMRPVQFEDLARQVLAHGKRKSAEEYAKEIGRITVHESQILSIFIFTKSI